MSRVHDGMAFPTCLRCQTPLTGDEGFCPDCDGHLDSGGETVTDYFLKRTARSIRAGRVLLGILAVIATCTLQPGEPVLSWSIGTTGYVSLLVLSFVSPLWAFLLAVPAAVGHGYLRLAMPPHEFFGFLDWFLALPFFSVIRMIAVWYKGHGRVPGDASPHSRLTPPPGAGHWDDETDLAFSMAALMLSEAASWRGGNSSKVFTCSVSRAMAGCMTQLLRMIWWNPVTPS